MQVTHMQPTTDGLHGCSDARWLLLPKEESNTSYPRSRSCIIDGEAVAWNDNGIASFDLVRHHRANERIFLYAFDIIELNGDDLRRDPAWGPQYANSTKLVRPMMDRTSFFQSFDDAWVARHWRRADQHFRAAKRGDAGLAVLWAWISVLSATFARGSGSSLN
jgi:hypothetical protein